MFGFFLVIPLVIIIITGNLLRGRGFYSQSDISALTKTLYWVILPPLLFRTTYTAGKEVLTQPNLLIASTLCYILTLIAAFTISSFLYKGNKKQIAVSVLASFRANNIYLGFPVVDLAMGAAGLHQASIYIAVTMISFQLISIAAGDIVMYGKVSRNGLCSIGRRLLTNPLIISCVLGVSTAMLKIPLPFVLDETMKLMSGAATAVALLALGGTLDLSRLSRVMGILKATWSDAVIKLLINPSIMYLLLLAFPVSKPLFQVTVMLSSMPCAINCFILAKGMGMDGEYAADLVAATTLLGIVSIPFWAYAVGLV